MTHTQKIRLVAASIFAAICTVEVVAICHLVRAGINTPFTLTSIIGTVLVFNASVWWFRHKYDSARIHYAQKDSEEENDT